MKNKFLFLSIAFILVAQFITDQLSAQITSQAYSEWVKVDSYKGSTTSAAFKYMIHIGKKEIEYEDWSMQVRANPVISNSEGKTIDPSRISIQLRNVKGGPKLKDFDAITKPIPLSFSDQYIIKKSDEDLEAEDDYYQQWVFEFDIIVAGGDYLEDIKSWKQYLMNLTFSLKDKSGRMITEASASVQMQIYPADMPPSGPTYGIEVNSNARNGLLNLKSVTDYVNGVEQVYENGLSITSKTDYQVQVRSLSSNFEADHNMTLPISTVSLQIQDPKKSGVGGTITLSENTQTVFSASNPGNGKKPRDFNLRYFTKANDERLINAKPASYQTTLMFTLVPQ